MVRIKKRNFQLKTENLKRTGNYNGGIIST